jgi:hypothetical protein
MPESASVYSFSQNFSVWAIQARIWSSNCRLLFSSTQGELQLLEKTR